MPETTKRVGVSLLFATDEEPAVVLASVTQTTGRLIANGARLESITAHGFDMADPDDPCVQLLVNDTGIARTFVDRPDLAEKYGKVLGAVVVELPIAADYRETTALEADHG